LRARKRIPGSLLVCDKSSAGQEGRMKVAIIGAGAGGAAAVAELATAHEVRLWGRASALAPFVAQAGVAYEGVLGEGLAEPKLITSDFAVATEAADAILVCLPTFAHADIARALASLRATAPVILNPGHTGGALEFSHTFRVFGAPPPPIAELSTLTYVARQYRPGRVTVTGTAKSVRLAALPGGEVAVAAAQRLFASAHPVSDVLACSLANVNMVLHTPGAVLGAAWVEATQGDFTFYVQGMTPGVARVMGALDGERRAVARAFGHELPPLVAEMQAIGTVEASARDLDDLAGAIAAGEANRRIKAPDSLAHRYYREDFGHGLLPFTVLAGVAGVDAPVAASLLRVAQSLTGIDFAAQGRTAERMGIAGLDRAGLWERVGAKRHG
jgi:opine dehydrogenase